MTSPVSMKSGLFLNLILAILFNCINSKNSSPSNNPAKNLLLESAYEKISSLYRSLNFAGITEGVAKSNAFYGLRTNFCS